MEKLFTRTRLNQHQNILSVKFDLSASPKGVYLLKVEAGPQTRIEKIMVQ